MNNTAHGYLRQTIATLVALSLVLSVFGPVGTVAAEPSVSVEQTADSTTVAPGETVTLTTEFEVAELNAPQLSVTTPNGWEITEQTAEGPVAYNDDGTWTWLAGGNDGVNASYTIEYTVRVPEDASGEYTITADGSALAPTDSAPTADSDSTTITVEDPDQNENPSASFTASPSSPDAGETVSFDASASSDADGSIASYEWDFGDGETATGATPIHTYDSAGDYDVTLTVTDDDGATDEVTQTVSISEVSDPANFQVSNLNAPDTATKGDAIDVSAAIENTGEQTAIQPVEFRVDVDGDGFDDDDDVVLSQDVQLDPGQSTTVEFTDIDISGLPADTYTHGVVTENDSATAEITINAPTPANFQVSNLNAPDTATKGDAIDVSAAIENTGNEEATQTVEFRLDGDGDGTLDGDEALVSQNVTLEGGETQTVTFEDIDTSGLLAGDYDHGVFSENDSETATITIDESDAITSETSVSLSPQSTEVVVGDTATYDVVVDNTDGGVGAYELTVSLNDASTASITDVTLADTPGLSDVSYAEDNSSVTIRAALLNTTDTGSVSIASITVEGTAEGSSNLSVNAQALGNEDGESYTVTGENGASISVIELLPVNGFPESPTDPDDDGLYEDVNGDGEFNIVDVQALFANLDDETVQNNPDKFDFNQDGEVDVVDVQKLYNEVLL